MLQAKVYKIHIKKLITGNMLIQKIENHTSIFLYILNEIFNTTIESINYLI